jgi:hypothetical protein
VFFSRVEFAIFLASILFLVCSFSCVFLVLLHVGSPSPLFSSPLPEGGEVDGRVIITDDSQETSLPESETAGSQRSAGSSDKETESGKPSDYAHSISPPPATSPEGRVKRKRDDAEDSGTSKPAEVIAEEISPEVEGAFDPFAAAGAVSS